MNKNELHHINFIIPNDQSLGSIRIRVINLINVLTKRGIQCDINAPISKKHDVVVFHKIIKKDAIKQCKKFGVLKVFNTDDYYEHMIDNCHLFDLILTSQEYLKNQFLVKNKNTVVLRNSLDIDNYQVPIKKQTNLKKKRIVWYGWLHNFDVVKTFNITGVTTIANGGDIEYNPQTIDSNLKKFDLVIIPQEKNLYTLSKTHCCFLKALYLGIPCLVQDMPEYISLAKELNYPEEFIVSKSDDWNAKIQAFLDNKLKCNFDFVQARNLILAKYSSEVVAEDFLRIISKELRKSPKHASFWEKCCSFVLCKKGCYKKNMASSGTMV